MPEAAVAKKQQDIDYLSRWLGTECPCFAVTFSVLTHSD